eukprot:6485002-Amphidinium_carterae.2
MGCLGLGDVYDLLKARTGCMRGSQQTYLEHHMAARTGVQTVNRNGTTCVLCQSIRDDDPSKTNGH